MSDLPSRPAFLSTPVELVRKSVAQDSEELDAKLAAKPWAPAKLRGPQLLALGNAGARASIDLDDPGIAADLERAACAGAALFGGLVVGDGQQVEAPVPFSDEVVLVTGATPNGRIGDPGYWRNALLAALAVRKWRAVALLGHVPIELLKRLTPTPPEWALLEYAALQALVQRSPDASNRLVAAARAANPDAVDEYSRDWVLDIVTPELQLAFRALDGDQAAFDTWMHAAIKGHHHYYQSDGARKKQPLSQIALAPLAMACIAHDLGIRTSVTTDYFPRNIIAP